MLRRLVLAMAMAVMGCAHSPYIEPFPPILTAPGEEEVVLVHDSVVVFDASGSIDREEVFPREKAVFESYVDGMPNGTYRSSVIVLGGRPNDHLTLKQFNRWKHRAHAYALSWNGRETPLAEVLREQAATLAEREGRAAMVVFSDGVPTRHGRYIGPDDTLTAGRLLVARRQSELCLHTIQVGSDSRGTALLEQLAELTPCGSFRILEHLDDADALHTFQQQIYIGPPPVAEPKRPRRITDLDGDGVDDRFDRCARTPAGAVVDERGCWVIADYVFATGRAEIVSGQETTLEAVVDVLQRNPELRIRLDGHTDDTGTAEFNFDLAEQRAEAVRLYLIGEGVDYERLELRGFGPTRPVASNETAEGRTQNRRVELSIISW